VKMEVEEPEQHAQQEQQQGGLLERIPEALLHSFARLHLEACAELQEGRLKVRAHETPACYSGARMMCLHLPLAGSGGGGGRGGGGMCACRSALSIDAARHCWAMRPFPSGLPITFYSALNHTPISAS